MKFVLDRVKNVTMITTHCECGYENNKLAYIDICPDCGKDLKILEARPYGKEE